jgi:hypothetical protein
MADMQAARERAALFRFSQSLIQKFLHNIKFLPADE